MSAPAPDPSPPRAWGGTGGAGGTGGIGVGEGAGWVLGQLGVLALVAAVAGVGVAGFAAGVGYLGCLLAVLDRALRRSGRRPGPADRVTLVRAVLVGGVVAGVGAQLAAGDARASATIVVMAALALALDGVDGRVARRTGTASPAGARFDLEVDAVLVLALSVSVAWELGAWVLAIGVMRYTFVAAAAWLAPWLRAPVPVRYSAKVVGVQQTVTLLVVAAGVLPAPLAEAAVVVALAALTWSFGHDVRVLRRRRHARNAGVTAIRLPERRPPG